MKVVAVIPARYASTRLPGKPLADIHGKPMVQWVYERAAAASGIDEVIVATDDPRVLSAVKGFGGKAEMTDPALASGTDRVAAVAERFKGDVWVNIQGDEPLMASRAIEAAAELVASRRFPMGTVVTSFVSPRELDEPSVVKALVDRSSRAVYFSRHPIPYSRGPRPDNASALACLKHVGLYAFDRDSLFRFRDLPPSDWERGESLEQLRALEHGIAIGVARVDFEAVGVDTPEDLEKARRLLAKGL